MEFQFLLFIWSSYCRIFARKWMITKYSYIFLSQNIPNWDFIHMHTWKRMFKCNLFLWDLDFFLINYFRIFFVHRKLSKNYLKNPTHFYLLNFPSLCSDATFVNLSSRKFTLVCFEVIFSVKMNITLENTDELWFLLNLKCYNSCYFMHINMQLFFQIWESSWRNIECDLVQIMQCQADILL